jgi:hypothetical protein
MIAFNKYIRTVFLASLVLLAIALGSLTYRAYSRIDDLERENQQLQAKHEQTINDGTVLAPDCQHPDSGLIAADYERRLETAALALKAAEQSAAEARNEQRRQIAEYDYRIEHFQRKLEEAACVIKQKEHDNEQLFAKLDRYFEDIAASKTRIDGALDAFNEGVPDKQADLKKALDALRRALPDHEAHLMRIRELYDENARLEAELRKARADLDSRIKKLEENIPQVDLLAYEQPRGKIVQVDNDQKMVRLNLGNADLVKPGLMFSVFAEGSYKPDAERKASLEVVEVIDEHSCRARVTEIQNAVRRPILVGDQLYNPAWVPGLRDHVAILGRIDLNDDGRDYTPEFIKALEKQGAIVDVWIDEKELAVKGAIKEIGPKTSYLILGEFADLKVEHDEVTLEKLMAFRQAAFELRDAARNRGVAIVNARRYMALAGMKVPKLAK